VRHFALLDPDPDSITSVDPYPNLNSESASTELIESGSNPDSDPKHCPTLPLFLSLWPVISDLQGEVGGGACSTRSQLRILLVGILVSLPPLVVLAL
jgi:hypothetical protein